MKTEGITRLLEKYYKGESSEDEELILRRFFDSEDIADEFATEKIMFRFYSDHAEVPEPSEGFEQRIISAIDSEEDKSGFKHQRNRRLVYSGIAAGLLILIGSYLFFINKYEPGDTFSNTEIAYAETMKILYSVSSKLNQGTESLRVVGKLDDAAEMSFSEINRSTRIIESNLKSLDYFQKAINIVASPMDINVNK